MSNEEREREILEGLEKRDRAREEDRRNRKRWNKYREEAPVADEPRESRAYRRAAEVGDDVDEPQPVRRSWLGKKVRQAKFKAKHSFVAREVVGGLREAKEEILGPSGPKAAGGGGGPSLRQRIQKGAKKRTAHLSPHFGTAGGTPTWAAAFGGGGGGYQPQRLTSSYGGDRGPHFMEERGPHFMAGGMGPQGGSGGGGVPHFMTGKGPSFMSAMGWTKAEKRAEKKKNRQAPRRGGRTVTINLGR